MPDKFKFIYIETTDFVTEYNVYSQAGNLPLGKIVLRRDEYRMFFFSAYTKTIGVSQDVMAECLAALESANKRVSYKPEPNEAEAHEYEF